MRFIFMSVLRLLLLVATLFFEEDDRIIFVATLPLFFEYAVLDIETTGLDPGYDEIVGFGWVQDNVVFGMVRKQKMSHKQIKREILRRIEHARRRGYDVYAWNKQFEESFLEVEGLKELQLYEYEKKDNALSWGIPIPANGAEVPRLWKKREYKKILMRAIYDTLIEATSIPRLILREVQDY